MGIWWGKLVIEVLLIRKGLLSSKKRWKVWQIGIKAVPLHSQTRDNIAEWSSW